MGSLYGLIPWGSTTSGRWEAARWARWRGAVDERSISVRHVVQSAMAEDYYRVLGVERDASLDAIKKAFRKIARECHPDRTGNDPVAAARFKSARTAYETLSDDNLRQRYDRRRSGSPGPRGSFFDAFYKNTGAQQKAGGPSRGAHVAGGHKSTRNARRNPANDLDLDDLFGDVGSSAFNAGPRPREKTTYEEHNRARSGAQGADVHVQVDVPRSVASQGGSVSVSYQRMKRPDSWSPSSGEAGQARVRELTEVRILPGTRSGQVVRERGLGDAGPYGGPYGDLLAQIRVVSDPPEARPPRASAPGNNPRPSTAPASEEGDLVVDIGIVEALLGGRVPLTVGGDTLRVTIPPGTSSGTKMRLRGKGPGGSDLGFRVRIVVPKSLDEESRALIQRFGELNPL